MFLTSNFKDYCQSQRWTIDRYTSEFTLQFRICRFLQSLDSNLVIELESNINRNSWEKSIKITYDEDTGESISNFNELYEDLDENDQKISDMMFSKLEEFIMYGEKSEEIQSDFPVLKENSFSNLSTEINEVFTDEYWDEDYMYITQESFWPLSLRFSD